MVLGATLGTFSIASASAQSAPAPPSSTCSTGRACFWADADRGLVRGSVAGSNPDWRAFSQASCVPPHAAASAGGTWNDCASSIENAGTTCAMLFYEHINYGGGYIRLAPGQSISNLWGRYFSNGHWANDAISSNRWVCP
jgi:Peptidase inhibitor family I36